MINSISSPTLTVPSAQPKDDKIAASKVQNADQALNALLNDSDMLQSLSDQSLAVAPPSNTVVLSTLWGLFNITGSHVITKEDVQKAVYAEGLGTTQANDLWAQLSPDGKDQITAGDFAQNTYLTKAVNANLSAEQDAVNVKRVEGGVAKSGTILDSILGTGGILSIFA